MPSYRDETTGKWYCKFYYTDYTGTRKQKKKRGFDTKREAQSWEREFLLMQQGSPEMTFKSLVDLYIRDAQTRMKKSSYDGILSPINCYLLPFFKDMQIMDITPSVIRSWQTWLKQKRHRYLKRPLSAATIKKTETLLTTLFNFAVRFYDLPANPLEKAGRIKTGQTRRIDFWTHDEFKHFIAAVDESQYHCLFLTLYYTGMRIGEALALTPADIDNKTGEISVTKTLYINGGEKTVTTPKTSKGIRYISIPGFLLQELQGFINSRYGLDEDDYIFTFSQPAIRKALKRYAAIAGVKTIRIHDLRHSHASHLIELGFPPLLIAERLGHTNIKMTLDVYSHLYPNKQKEVSQKLESIFKL